MKLNNTYFLLRHGQTEYQLPPKSERIIYPFPEPQPILLTGKGVEGVREAAERLKKEKVDLIFSSPIPRTRQTAEIIGERLGLKINFDERLKEVNEGIYRGGPRKELLKAFPDRKDRFYRRLPQGESWQDVRKRAADFIKEIEAKYKNKRILIVSHGNPLWFIESVLKGASEEEAFGQDFTTPFKTAELREFS